MTVETLPVIRELPPRPWVVDGETIRDANGRPIALIPDPDLREHVMRVLGTHEQTRELLQAMSDQAAIAIGFGGRLHLTDELEQRALKILNEPF